MAICYTVNPAFQMFDSEGMTLVCDAQGSQVLVFREFESELFKMAEGKTWEGLLGAVEESFEGPNIAADLSVFINELIERQVLVVTNHD